MKPAARKKESVAGERARTEYWAQRLGIDPAFLWAIRRTENGGPGREFGILYRPGAGDSFDGQARLAAMTVKNTLDRYRNHVRRDPIGPDGRYTEDFIRYFSHGGPGYPGYAPLGTANDPKNLNKNHLPNMLRYYEGGRAVQLKPTDDKQQEPAAQAPFGRSTQPFATDPASESPAASPALKPGAQAPTPDAGMAHGVSPLLLALLRALGPAPAQAAAPQAPAAAPSTPAGRLAMQATQQPAYAITEDMTPQMRHLAATQPGGTAGMKGWLDAASIASPGAIAAVGNPQNTPADKDIAANPELRIPTAALNSLLRVMGVFGSPLGRYAPAVQGSLKVAGQ